MTDHDQYHIFPLRIPDRFLSDSWTKFFFVETKIRLEKSPKKYSVYKLIISDHDCYLANFTYLMRTHGIPTFRTPPKCGQIIFGIAFQYF